MPDGPSATPGSEETLTINRACWNQAARKFHGGTALPTYGPLAPTEDTLRLLGPLAGTRVLELGCGSGHSLRYAAEQGAAEVWGLDLSPVQIAFATEVLQPFQPRVRLVESAMEVNPGIPANHFDLVISIYGLGWTTDLAATLALAADYLRPGGTLVFSGEHPAYRCAEYSNEQYVLVRPYTEEGPEFKTSWSGAPTVLQRRTLATLVNGVVKAGLRLEALIESELNADGEGHADPSRWYSIPRARLIPTTFIIKARKPVGE